MKDKKEILIDAIGKVNDKYIENSMSTDKASSLLIDDLISAQSGNAYEVKPVPQPEKKKFPVKMAVLTGLAAALMITAAGVVINRLGAGKIEVGGGNSTTTATSAVTDVPAVTTDDDLPPESDKQRRLEYLRNKYPGYFECSAFKGLEVYADKGDDGEWQLRLMGGTNRNKTTDEVTALPPASVSEMRTILDWYREQSQEANDFIFLLDPYTMSEIYDRELIEALGLDRVNGDAVPTDTVNGQDDTVYDGNDIRTFRSYNEISGENTIPVFDPYSGEYDGMDRLYFKKMAVTDGMQYINVYLAGMDVSADADDPHLFYGRLYVLITEPGTDNIVSWFDVYDYPDIYLQGSDVHLYSFRTDRLSDYFDIFTFRDSAGNMEHNVIKTAYGTYGEGFDTGFRLLNKDGTIEKFNYNFERLAEGFKTDGGVMLSHSLAYPENIPFDLVDTINGTMLRFDFENRELWVAEPGDPGTPDTTPDVAEADDIVLPADDGTPEDVLTVDDLTVIPNYNELVTATFEIQTQTIYRHDPNPGENPPWYSLAVIGGNVYSMETFDITAETFLKETEDMYVDTDYFRQVIKQYCEGDALVPDKLEDGSAIKVTAAGFLDNEPLRGTYYYLNENYVLSTYDSGKSFRVYKLDATHTKFRKIIELLWDRHRSTNTPYDETRYFPHVMAVMTKDFDTDEEYLKIINDGKLDKIKSAITEEVPGAEGLYRLVTPEQEKADWLPVTELRDLGEGALAYENTSQVDGYNVAFDCGVYSDGATYYDSTTYDLYTEYDAIADRLTELGAGEAAEKFREEAKTAASNGFSFETVTAYDSILDYVKLGNRWSIYWKITDDIIIEYFLNYNGEPYPLDGDLVRILTKEPQLTRVRNIVNYFRDRRETTMYHNDTGGEVYYKIDQLYVIWDKLKTPGSTEPNAKFLVLTDREEYADYIREYAQYNQIDIPGDRLTITSNPIDLGDIPTYDPF